MFEIQVRTKEWGVLAYANISKYELPMTSGSDLWLEMYDADGEVHVVAMDAILSINITRVGDPETETSKNYYNPFENV